MHIVSAHNYDYVTLHYHFDKYDAYICCNTVVLHIVK